jgi:hypothetical protein
MAGFFILTEVVFFLGVSLVFRGVSLEGVLSAGGADAVGVAAGAGDAAGAGAEGGAVDADAGVLVEVWA